MRQAALLNSEAAMYPVGCQSRSNFQTENPVAGFNQLKLRAFYLPDNGGFWLVKN